MAEKVQNQKVTKYIDILYSINVYSINRRICDHFNISKSTCENKYLSYCIP